MIAKINELESKGFRICIYPQRFNGTWKWVAGVYVGDCNVALWLPNNGQPRNSYDNYEDAFNDLVSFCETYKAPRIVEESSKGQGRSSSKTSRKKV